MLQRSTLAAAAVAALLSTPAFAASTASASLGPITVTLFDLNPLDSIAPSITFNDPYGYGSYVYANAYDTYTGQNSYPSLFGTGAFAPVSVSTSGVTNAWASADVSGPGTAAGTTLNASGSALGTAAPGAFSYQYSQYQSGSYAPYYYYTSFTLSANTLALISAPVSLSTAVTHTWDPATSYEWEYASANASINLSGTGGSGSGSQSSYDSRSLGVSSTYVYDPSCTYAGCYYYTGSSATDSATIGGSFVNFTSGTLDGNVQMNVNTYGYSYAPVPEPGTYALLLAGLGAVGFMARRRRA